MYNGNMSNDVRAPGKGREITESWSKELDEFIESKGRSYVRELAQRVGCSPSTISQLRLHQVKFSKWAETVARLTGISLPPDNLDQETRKLYETLGKLSKEDRAEILAIAQVKLSRKK